MAHPQQKLLQDSPFVFDDALCCEEVQWEGEVRESYFFTVNDGNTFDNAPNLPLQFIEQDLYWEDHELSTLLAKEEENPIHEALLTNANPSLAETRREAVEWMLRVHAHYSFSILTAVLSVNYFDRFLSSFHFQRDKPWMAQLAAVACLSLAAKVEETHVPLLLDLQVEETKFVFESKTIQRMEILVLSTLDWKMNPVTSHSFLEYISRRLGLKDHLCCEFLRRCERVLLSIISDSRFLRYLPSVIAAAAMSHVVNNLEPCIEDDCRNQLLRIIGSDKDKVEECCQLILELASGGKILLSNKRKSVSLPGSPNGVIDVSFSSDSSNDYWAVESSASSSPEPLSKKIRAEDRNLERFSPPSLTS
ncbi:hypothetical protein Nepgr_018492 [Nepenthes gracilis]|uniref:Uncharacterized protein n=1 Tax=Nepenthes gracilis TaxID=150966 RepID=A0AAD3XUD2_NEPGR|nr:hypothetical protein Nepgr_018492 [Nepenthes gracilis]